MSLFSEEAFSVVGLIANYFIPFLAVSTGILVLYANIDRIVSKIKKSKKNKKVKTIEDRLFIIDLKSFLNEVRIAKTSAIRTAVVFFLLTSFGLALTFCLDVYNLLPECFRHFAIFATVLNWIYMLIAIIEVSSLYEHLQFNIHKINDEQKKRKWWK